MRFTHIAAALAVATAPLPALATGHLPDLGGVDDELVRLDSHGEGLDRQR